MDFSLLLDTNDDSQKTLEHSQCPERRCQHTSDSTKLSFKNKDKIKIFWDNENFQKIRIPYTLNQNQSSWKSITKKELEKCTLSFGNFKIPLKNLWLREDITMEIRKYLELNKSEKAMYQNLQDWIHKLWYIPTVEYVQV